MTKTDIAIYRGLKEKFDPEVHVGFFITTDTGELLLGDQSLGQTISGWEINDGVLKLTLNTGKDIRVTFPEATETVKGLLSAADKAQLNALQANLDSKVDKVTGKSLLADSEITKLAGLPNSTELTNSIATAKAAGDNAQSDLNSHKLNKSNPHEVTKAQVGLGNVTNDAQVKRSEMGVANGVATLDADGKVPATQLPSYVDDIIDVYATYSKSDTGVLSNVTLYLDAAHTKPVTGEAGKIYQNIADGEPQYQFRWTGTIFSQTGASSLILGEVTGTAYDGAKGKANADNIAKIKGTSLSHIKDAAPVTTAADKVSINYECYEGNQYGAAGTDHTADIPAATTTKAGVMSAADKTKLENLNSKLVVADEEDVTAVDGKIKFKDRDTTNGMGYKILRLPENGILTQDMINQDNTIYEIRYNFDLNDATITIPENCTLKFEGGSLQNGVIIFNGTQIQSENGDILIQCTLKGKVKNKELPVKYLGIHPNNTNLNSTLILEKALSVDTTFVFEDGNYYFSELYISGGTLDDTNYKYPFRILGSSLPIFNRTIFYPFEKNQHYIIKCGGGKSTYGLKEDCCYRPFIKGITFGGLKDKPLINASTEENVFHCGYLILDRIEVANINVAGTTIIDAPLVTFGYAYEMNVDYVTMYGLSAKSTCPVIHFCPGDKSSPISTTIFDKIQVEVVTGPIISSAPGALLNEVIINNITYEGSQMWDYLGGVVNPSTDVTREILNDYDTESQIHNYLTNYNHIPLFRLYGGNLRIKTLSVTNAFFSWINSKDNNNLRNVLCLAELLDTSDSVQIYIDNLSYNHPYYYVKDLYKGTSMYRREVNINSIYGNAQYINTGDSNIYRNIPINLSEKYITTKYDTPSVKSGDIISFKNADTFLSKEFIENVGKGYSIQPKANDEFIYDYSIVSRCTLNGCKLIDFCYISHEMQLSLTGCTAYTGPIVFNVNYYNKDKELIATKSYKNSVTSNKVFNIPIYLEDIENSKFFDITTSTIGYSILIDSINVYHVAGATNWKIIR